MKNKLFFTLTLFCAWAFANAQTPITIPTATIIVDGDTADWNGITTAAADPQGDDSPSYTGDDIKSIYLAKDNTNLYLRLDLYDNANPNFGNGGSPNEGRYHFEIYSNSSTYSSLGLGLANYSCGQQWTLGCNGANGNAPTSLQGTSFVGVNNNVIEIKVPLSDIAYPSAFYQVSSIVNNCCLPNFETLDSLGVGSLTLGILSVISNPPTISISPNPFSGSATINFYNLRSGNYDFKIFDILGSEVLNSKIVNDKLEVQKGNLSNGIYFYLLQGEREVLATGKIVIQ